jgi:hypothetical protein
MHHPACWVKNGGCATNTEHQPVPIALAYANDKPLSGQAPHPGEGTRVAGPSRPPDTAGTTRGPALPPRHAAGTVAGPAPPTNEDAMVIGEAPAVRVVPGPAPVGGEPRKPPVASRGYKVDRNGKPMPRVYGGHRLLQYWYVPAAILVAAGVALGVIFVAGLFGDDDDPDAAGAGETTTVSPTSEATADTTQTPQATSSASPTGGIFQVNDQVAITGVGSGAGGEAACLNIRTEPGTDQVIIDCLREGTELTISGGPEEAGGLTWWRVTLASGDGWAAEEYLQKR